VSLPPSFLFSFLLLTVFCTSHFPPPSAHQHQQLHPCFPSTPCPFFYSQPLPQHPPPGILSSPTVTFSSQFPPSPLSNLLDSAQPFCCLFSYFVFSLKNTPQPPPFSLKRDPRASTHFPSRQAVHLRFAINITALRNSKISSILFRRSPPWLPENQGLV